MTLNLTPLQEKLEEVEQMEYQQVLWRLATTTSSIDTHLYYILSQQVLRMLYSCNVLCLFVSSEVDVKRRLTKQK